LNYGFILARREVISMNESLAAHYFKLSADQGVVSAEAIFANILLSEQKDQRNTDLGVEYLRRAADHGLVSAQLRFAILLRQGRLIEPDLGQSAYYFKLAADQGSIEGKLEYAACLLHGDGVSIDYRKCENYLRQSAEQGDVRGQMRLGICLLSGLLGKFEFNEARALFDLASVSNQFAKYLRDSLSQSDFEIITRSEFSSKGNIFSILRSSSNESIPLIRLLNFHFDGYDESDHRHLLVWQEVARLSFEYLINLSQTEEYQLRSFPSDLLLCESILDMTKLIFRMYTANCSLYENANHFLRCFPVKIVGKFMKELKPILHYIYLLQSSLEYYSYRCPLSEDMIVYRGILSGGQRLAPVYASMINEVIIWPGFTSTSRSRDVAHRDFIKDEDSMLFEIELHPGDVASSIESYSDFPAESEILIAASTRFKILGIEYVEVEIKKSKKLKVVTIPVVKLSYVLSWSEFDLDDRPPVVLVEGDGM
jgi:hypothetical protein